MQSDVSSTSKTSTANWNRYSTAAAYSPNINPPEANNLNANLDNEEELDNSDNKIDNVTPPNLSVNDESNEDESNTSFINDNPAN